MMKRQGDILVEKVSVDISSMKEVERDAGRVVLAYGEATGHAHAFKDDHVKMFSANDNSGRRFIVISKNPAILYHEEHAPLTFDPGIYEVIRQREWSDDNEPIQVAD